VTTEEDGVFSRIRAGLALDKKPWPNPHGEIDHPQAGVLVALTDTPEPCVLLGRRALHLPHHPGEIAFAGGKREVEDESAWATASREAAEEVGLTMDVIEPLGELAPMITRTGFEVHPCVARIPGSPDLIVDPSEFDSVFLPPLAAFSDPSLYRLEKMFDGEHYRMVPHYQVGDDNVWGVTAAILALLVNVAYDAGFDLKRDWKEAP
jgi:8-oxo-dGTP pyrophosphatase MutT (NUDIX family)